MKTIIPPTASFHRWVHGCAQPGTGGFMDVHSQTQVGSWMCTAWNGWFHGRAQPGTGGLWMSFSSLACFLCFDLDVIRLEPYNASIILCFCSILGGGALKLTRLQSFPPKKRIPRKYVQHNIHTTQQHP